MNASRWIRPHGIYARAHEIEETCRAVQGRSPAPLDEVHVRPE